MHVLDNFAIRVKNNVSLVVSAVKVAEEILSTNFSSFSASEYVSHLQSCSIPLKLSLTYYLFASKLAAFMKADRLPRMASRIRGVCSRSNCAAKLMAPALTWRF